MTEEYKKRLEETYTRASLGSMDHLPNIIYNENGMYSRRASGEVVFVPWAEIKDE